MLAEWKFWKKKLMLELEVFWIIFKKLLNHLHLFDIILNLKLVVYCLLNFVNGFWNFKAFHSVYWRPKIISNYYVVDSFYLYIF